MIRNKLTQKILVIAMLTGTTGLVNAQSKVGQNAVSINSNAVFELEHNSKGLLLPRLALTSTAASTPMTTHVSGMIIYNTSTVSDVTPGFYYNDGTKWVRLAASAGTGGGSLTNDNGIIVTGGTGATFSNASLRLDSTAVAKMIGKSPVRDSFASLTTQLITAGGIAGQNLSAGVLLQTTGTPTGASLKAAGYQVDTTALKTFISNTASTGTLTGQNLTAGNLLQTTGTPTGASLKTAGYQVDTTALKTYIANRVNTAPIKDSLTTVINNQITTGSVTGQNLTAGNLLQTTGTPTGASLKTAGYQVDTTALKTFIANRVGSSPIRDSLANMTSDSTTASNGLTMTGKDVRLGGTLTAATTITGGANTLAISSTATNGFSVDGTTFSVDAANNRVGIGTTNPTSALEINGSATNTSAFNAGSSTAINFANSNLAYTTADAGAFTLSGMKDGGTYTLAVQGATSGTSSFTHAGLTFRQVNNGITMAASHTLYTFIVMGTNVYYWMNVGF